MITSFALNGHIWRVVKVRPDSPKLIDRTNTFRVATTDPDTRCVYISSEIYGDFLIRVVLHELGHCVMFSYNLIDEIHRMVYPPYWVETEEWICNFIADYGRIIFTAASKYFGDYGWIFVPLELERLIA